MMVYERFQASAVEMTRTAFFLGYYAASSGNCTTTRRVITQKSAVLTMACSQPKRSH